MKRIDGSDTPAPKATFAVATQGCRANQSDSGQVDVRLIRAGLTRVAFGEPADVTVVNTCTVTAPSDRQSRQMVYRALRASPEGLTFILGCWPRFRADEADRVAGRAVVITEPDPERAADAILKRVGREGLWGRRAKSPPAMRNPIPTKTRPPLKIQDGCGGSCAYCAVRLARGEPRSMAADDVFANLARLSGQGVKEVVLTGINLGTWGHDLDPPDRLAGLLNRYAAERPVARLRLSSVEPQEVDPGLLEAVARPDSGICPHLHLPMQSGSDRVLSAMGRPYTSADYAHIVRFARTLMKDAALGADVMLGLPGEDDGAYRKTLELVNSLPLTYIHVFPYSPRPGTRAFTMDDVPDRATVKARSEKLRAMGEEKRFMFWKSQEGKVRAAVVEERRCDKTGMLVAITDNFIPVRVSGPDSLMGELVRLRIQTVADRVTGELTEENQWK